MLTTALFLMPNQIDHPVDLEWTWTGSESGPELDNIEHCTHARVRKVFYLK